MFTDIQLSDFPPVAKLFVGMGTTLMLCVCLWAVLIFYVEQGMVDSEHLPAYLTNEEHGHISDYTSRNADEHETNEEKDFRHNVGLAHTHINGQTLLFYAMGMIFLFTSTPIKTKKLVLWLFGISVFLHAIGLTGHRYHWFFDDILAISGVVILVMIAYMALRIYVDIGKRPVKAL